MRHWPGALAKQAVITWKANQQLVGQGSDLLHSSLICHVLLLTAYLCRSVFLIAAANTFLRFIHFRFGSHYAEYIDAIGGSAQEALLRDSGKDTLVCTPRKARSGAICNQVKEEECATFWHF